MKEDGKRNTHIGGRHDKMLDQNEMTLYNAITSYCFVGR